MSAPGPTKAERLATALADHKAAKRAAWRTYRRATGSAWRTKEAAKGPAGQAYGCAVRVAWLVYWRVIEPIIADRALGEAGS